MSGTDRAASPTYRVLVSCVQMQNELDTFRADLEARGIELVVPEITHQQLNPDELLEIMPEIDGVIAGDDFFTAEVLEASKKLKILSKWGIGTDAIDKDAAARLGIPVTNTPGMFGDEVADVATGFILMLARRLHVIDRNVREGNWLKFEGETLRGQTLGVIGLGDIGRGIVSRGQALGLTVVGFDPWGPSQEAAAALGVQVLDTSDDVFRRADWLALACPLTPENHHLVNARTIELMPAGARIVNVARGPIVDEAALIEALQRGRLGGAGLDVFESEPLDPASPLTAMDNVVLGAHNGSNTRQAVARTSQRAVANLLAHLYPERS